MEIWKDIVGYDGLYQISNMGRVKSLERIARNNHKIKEKILTPNLNKGGYLRVHLRKDNYSYTPLIHRLVAQAFLPNPNNKPQIDHINTNKTDNRVCNLRWTTASENMKNPITLESSRIANSGENNPMFGVIGANNKRSRTVLQFTKDGEFIKKWDCINDIKRELGINAVLINRVCKGLQEQTYNYIFKYYVDYKS